MGKKLNINQATDKTKRKSLAERMFSQIVSLLHGGEPKRQLATLCWDTAYKPPKVRTEAEKARKRTMRHNRQKRINRRGF